MDYRDKTVLVCDNGLFIELARTLAESFGTVYYFSPWESAFPTSNHLLIGTGIEGVKRVQSIWDVYSEVDLWVFPDVYFGALQEYLVSQGKRVWGSRTGEILELDREWSKETCKDLGIDIGPYQVVRGMSNLREYLQSNVKQFVKVSTTRGDMETFYSKRYDLVEPKLDEIEYKLGAKKELMEFIVEASIENAVEVGYDGFTIDGKYAARAMYGIEVKDKGLIAETVPYLRLPKSVREVNRKLKSFFMDYSYRGFFSSEIRVTKDAAYLIDPCCRMGSPPGELYLLMVSNWAEIIWEGADGTVVDPKFVGTFGAELMLRSEWANRNWQPIAFPAELRDYIKLWNLTIIDDKYYVVPQGFEKPDIGAIVAYGDTLDDAISQVTDMAERVEGYYLETAPECLNEAREQYNKLKTLE